MSSTPTPANRKGRHKISGLDSSNDKGIHSSRDESEHGGWSNLDQYRTHSVSRKVANSKHFVDSKYESDMLSDSHIESEKTYDSLQIRESNLRRNMREYDIFEEHIELVVSTMRANV